MPSTPVHGFVVDKAEHGGVEGMLYWLPQQQAIAIVVISSKPRSSLAKSLHSLLYR